MGAYTRPSGGWGEFVLVVGSAFGLFIVVSVYYAFHPVGFAGHTTGSFWSLTIFELVFLAVLGSVLRFRGWTARSLGLTFHWTDIPYGIALAGVAWLGYCAMLWALTFLSPQLAAAGPQVMTAGISPSAAVSVTVVNPFYEELFVAGYIIAALKDGPRTGLAINMSVAVRLLYHLYQGIAGVALIVPFGLIFATWFARTRRLWPLILAHALFDAAGFLPYIRW
jgi:CAAX amino terminal protease family.